MISIELHHNGVKCACSIWWWNSACTAKRKGVAIQWIRHIPLAIAPRASDDLMESEAKVYWFSLCSCATLLQKYKKLRLGEMTSQLVANSNVTDIKSHSNFLDSLFHFAQ